MIKAALTSIHLFMSELKLLEIRSLPTKRIILIIFFFNKYLYFLKKDYPFSVYFDMLFFRFRELKAAPAWQICKRLCRRKRRRSCSWGESWRRAEPHRSVENSIRRRTLCGLKPWTQVTERGNVRQCFHGPKSASFYSFYLRFYFPQTFDRHIYCFSLYNICSWF